MAEVEERCARARSSGVSLSALKMYRLAGGRIVEFWSETDLYGFMRQLGRVPAEIVFCGNELRVAFLRPTTV